MDCQNIVLIWMNSALDSKDEIAANVKSLKYKNEAKQRTCHIVEYDTVVDSLAGKGTIGVYILCHPGDFDATSFVAWFSKNFRDSISEIKKINLACCKSAENLRQGRLALFCNALVLEHKREGGVRMPDGLKVCGFSVALTTFDLDPNGYIAKKYTSANPALFDKDQTRQVGSVKQDGMTLTFVHEIIPVGGAEQFIKDAKKLFRERLPAVWDAKKENFVATKVNNSLKPKDRLQNISGITWEHFCQAYSVNATRFVKTVFWDHFIKELSSVNEASARMWDSLVKYIMMKKAYKFTGDKFVMIELAEYTDNLDMRNALTFVGNADEASGALIFMPE